MLSRFHSTVAFLRAIVRVLRGRAAWPRPWVMYIDGYYAAALPFGRPPHFEVSFADGREHIVEVSEPEEAGRRHRWTVRPGEEPHHLGPPDSQSERVELVKR